MDKTDELFRIAARYVGRVSTAYLNVVRRFLEEVTDNDVVSVLRISGVVSKAYSSIDELLDVLDGYVDDELIPVLSDAWMETGKTVVGIVLPTRAVIAPYQFDIKRVSALVGMYGRRVQLAQDLRIAQRQAISQVINRGIATGMRVRDVAKGIRSVIGLTSVQDIWVENYRTQLESGNLSVLQRALRDKRSDSYIRRLFESGEVLPQGRIDTLVEGYRQRMVRMRANTIAKTETLRAVRMGEYDAIEDAYLAGALDERLRRFWVTSGDERVRGTHVRIPSMNPDGRSVTESFQTPLGLLRYPCDPAGVAANVINCRCRLIYRLPTVGGVYRNIPTTSEVPLDVSAVLN